MHSATCAGSRFGAFGRWKRRFFELDAESFAYKNTAEVTQHTSHTRNLIALKWMTEEKCCLAFASQSNVRTQIDMTGFAVEHESNNLTFKIVTKVRVGPGFALLKSMLLCD